MRAGSYQAECDSRGCDRVLCIFTEFPEPECIDEDVGGHDEVAQHYGQCEFEDIAQDVSLGQIYAGAVFHLLLRLQP